MGDKQRIIDLQRQVRVGRQALEKIARGTMQAEAIAEEALDQMMAADRPVDRAPLAGILGWERRRG